MYKQQREKCYPGNVKINGAHMLVSIFLNKNDFLDASSSGWAS